ncbi:MAG TPA: hypothetical protein EYH27_00025 [Anaerolineales bacterium]|nr:hypothetical protein [Anaerolineae bacterium]HIP86807.1 hypothetical protein [Anaerolineales bacterium]
MHSCRVFVLTAHPLFAEGVETLLRGQPGLEVVGAGSVAPETFDHLREILPDVVVVGASGGEQESLLSRLFQELPGVKVVALNLDDNRIRIYYHQTKVGRQVEDLVEAIRQPLEWGGPRPATMRIFAIVQGRYGQRIVENIRAFGPQGWTVESWRPPDLPAVLDDPGHYLPLHVPPADLILALGESPATAQLIPDIVRRADARAVIAPVDHLAWLPEGLIRQLQERLRRLGVEAVFPRPFCSLTEDGYNLRHQRVVCSNPWISEFARHFGRPVFRIHCEDGVVKAVEVERDAACGCARFVAERLVGVPVEEAVHQAGLYHHHYPCLAGMTIERSLGDTLLHLSGQLMRQAVEVEVAPLLPRAAYLVPKGRSETR